MIDYVTTQSVGACIRVVGIGGGGGNAINNMISRGLGGVEYIAANTDLQALERNLASIKVQLGRELTHGLGAGANPEIGQRAAEENLEEIQGLLENSDMVFITAGMGGGTGTGAAPVIARVAKELGALVVGVVTRPFAWEGRKRIQIAEQGIAEMRKYVDALIVIPNQRLLEIIDPKTRMQEAFFKVDEVLYNAVRGIVDIISEVGYINVDFADVRTIMANTGDALMGIGSATGENRAMEAAEMALFSPLLDGVSINGARGVLVNITADPSLTMQEVTEAISFIERSAGGEVNLIHGVVIDEQLEAEQPLMVTVIATGFSSAETASESVTSPATANIPLSRDRITGRPQSPSKLPTPPRGSEALQYYDIPTYVRRQQEQASESTDAATNENKKKLSAEAMNRPAFLRKIMD